MNSSPATHLLLELRAGDPNAADRLLPLVYDELRSLARRIMRSEPEGHTLQPTALVHEAYLRLVDQQSVDWRNRAHFLAIAALAMRRVLVDHARRRAAGKRGGGAFVTLTGDTAVEETTVDVLSLDQALTRLAEVDERLERVVELRFFGGLGVREAAAVLEVSPATIKRDWRFAKAWLGRELASETG